MCAGNPETRESACHGDSGGPLIQFQGSKVNANYYVQIGQFLYPIKYLLKIRLKPIDNKTMSKENRLGSCVEFRSVNKFNKIKLYFLIDMKMVSVLFRLHFLLYILRRVTN
jgi:hypothetical protein